jgi:hypothetical protein
MDIDSIGRAGDSVVSPIAPPPQQQEEPRQEVSAPPPEPAVDTGKTLDLYA